MKAIKTKFLGPTNTKGSRIKATDEGGNSIIKSWCHKSNSDDNHRSAAYALCIKMGWDVPGKLVGGSLKNCMVWVFVD